MKKIELSLAKALPLMDAALPSLELGVCSYMAPCIVGSAMTPQERKQLWEDGYDMHNISHLVREGLVNIPERERDTFCALQFMFDNRRGDKLKETISKMREALNV